MMKDDAIDATAQIRQFLSDAGLDPESADESTLVVQLPGERKLQTTVSIRIGAHGVSLNAFVARHPDENMAGVYRWLLEQNRRMGAAHYCVDHLGDIYLTAKIPLAALSAEAFDQALGTILKHADGDFNAILERGFRTSIEREWRWRLSRGEPTENLAAFRHLAPADVPGSPTAGAVDEDSSGEVPG